MRALDLGLCDLDHIILQYNPSSGCQFRDDHGFRNAPATLPSAKTVRPFGCMPRADFRLHRRSRWPIGSVQTDQRSPRSCPQALRRPTNRGRHPEHPRGCTQPAAHPAAKCQNGRRLPARRSGRECTGRSPPTPIRARRAPSAPDEGRCRADPHCTRDGGGRHCHTCSSSHVVQQYPGRFGAGGPTRSGQPAQGGQDRLEADVVRPSRKGREAGDLLQRRGRPTAVHVPQGRRFSHVPQGRELHEGGRVAAAAGSAASSRPAGSGPPGSCAGCGAGSPRLRLRVYRMPPAPTRRTGPASDNTSPVATTAQATAARTSSNSGRGQR